MALVCQRDKFYKIKLCPFLPYKKCRKGKFCRYAHSLQELCVAVSLRKTKYCKAWRQGECQDENCRFAHGEEELRSTMDFYKTSICKYWEKGYCGSGDSCRHAHGVQEIREGPYQHHVESRRSKNKKNVEPPSALEKTSNVNLFHKRDSLDSVLALSVLLDGTTVHNIESAPVPRLLNPAKTLSSTKESRGSSPSSSPPPLYLYGEIPLDVTNPPVICCSTTTTRPLYSIPLLRASATLLDSKTGDLSRLKSSQSRAKRVNDKDPVKHQSGVCEKLSYYFYLLWNNLI